MGHSCNWKGAVLWAVVGVMLAGSHARADDYLEYIGGIDVGLPLGRIVADPVRSKVYGITGDGEVVFMDRPSMQVEQVHATGRMTRDIDVHPSGGYMVVLDNVTGEYWNQPPAVYALKYDLGSQTVDEVKLLQAPMFQIALASNDRVVGVATNQWVDAYLVDWATGQQLDSRGAGYYGGTSWQAQTFVTSQDGDTLYRTELGLSRIELLAFDISGDEIIALGDREVGSYGTEPVFINGNDTSLYVGDIRFDPDDIGVVTGVFPEMIYAGTSDNKLAFSSGGIYDPIFGGRLGDMPVNSTMLSIGDHERYLYAFDDATQTLHVMRIIPEPTTLSAIGVCCLLALYRRRSKTD